MKTEVVMKRELFGEQISQKSKSEFFSATDLVRAGNKWRLLNGLSEFKALQFYQSASFKEFKKTLEEKYGDVMASGRGRGKHTWVHPLLFIDIALAINPKLKVEVYEWLFDHLIRYRNDSGNSYKRMCGALFDKYPSKTKFHEFISKVADTIKIACGVHDWQTATQAQLEKRNKIHDNIYLLCDVLNSHEEAIRLAIVKTI